VDDDAVLAVLRQADATAELPRLGGLARPDGVAIVSERIWCFSSGAGGPLRTRAMPAAPVALGRLPFVRGLVKLALALAPLLSRQGAARPRERAVLLAALLAPVPLALTPGSYRGAILGAVTVAALAWMLRGPTLRLHGAEHRAIAAAEARRLVSTWQGHARPSRFSVRCGTNFAALVIPVAYLLERLWVPSPAALAPLLVTLVALTLTMEVWIAAQRSRPAVTRLVMAPGLALQRLSTREPRLDETRVALRAVAGVLAHDPRFALADPAVAR
jgi:hypothetical protein